MFKKFLLTASVFASLTFASNAQETVTVNWGPVIKNPKKTYTKQIIGADKEGFFTLRANAGFFNRDESPFIERYDSKNSLAFSKQLVIPAPTKSKIKFEFQDIYYLKGQLILFSSYLNKETDTYFSFASKVGPDGTVSGDMVELSRMEATKKKDVVDYDFTLSTDSSKILIFQHRPYQKNRPEQFDLKVLDNSLQPLYTKKIEMAFADNEVAIEKYMVDKFGNAYVLMKVDKPRSEKSSGTQKYYYKIMAYFYKEDQLKEYDLKLSDKFISDASFILDKNENLLVGGFFADNKKMAVAGTYFLKIDAASKKVLQAATKDFSAQFLAGFMKDRKANKEDAGIKNLNLRDIILRNDGSVTMAAEQHWVEIVTHNNGKTTTTSYHYHNNDLILVNIAPEGEINWMTHVPKKQTTVNDGGIFNSYSLVVDDKNKMRILFNDHVKNIGITNPRDFHNMNRITKAVTTLVTVDGNGQIQRTPLFPAKDNKTIIQPKFYMRGHNSLIIYSQKGKDLRFGKISFS